MDNQKLAFYSGKWSQFDDNIFITHLEFFAGQERRPLNKDHYEIMETVCDWLNPKAMFFNGEAVIPPHLYTLSDCYRRFELAELRYHTWKHIIGYKDVAYDPVSNTIKASTEVWIKQCEMHSLGHAYIWEPEYRWTQLRNIFDEGACKLKVPTGFSTAPAFSNMFDDLLIDINKAADDSFMDGDSDSESEMGLSPISPLDLMSTTKGKGHILFDPVARTISPHLRFAGPFLSDVSPATSEGAKRFLDF